MSWKYVIAFKKNCPKVRMLDDEEKELKRLFDVAKQESVDDVLSNMRTE